MTNKRKRKRFMRFQNAKRNRKLYYKKAENVYKAYGGIEAYLKRAAVLSMGYGQAFVRVPELIARAPIMDLIAELREKRITDLLS